MIEGLVRAVSASENITSPTTMSKKLSAIGDILYLNAKPFNRDIHLLMILNERRVSVNSPLSIWTRR